MTQAVFIVGPTAVGKTDLSVHLATLFNGEIIIADSRQVYRFMDIGTAKPTPEERQKITHHLLDILNPDQEFNLALFMKVANQALENIHKKHKLPIVVGGTGQYIKALLEGWRVPVVPACPRFRQKLEEEAKLTGVATLHKRLESVDSQSAARIATTNLRRIIRALEIYEVTGSAPSEVQGKSPSTCQNFVIGINTTRQQLYSRIDHRVDKMMAQGLVKEVSHLVNMGYKPDLPSMSSLGYHEILLYINGTVALEEAVQRIKYQTHRFARHQYNWFRLKDPGIHWLESGPDTPVEAEELVGQFLGQRTAMIE